MKILEGGFFPVRTTVIIRNIGHRKSTNVVTSLPTVWLGHLLDVQKVADPKPIRPAFQVTAQILVNSTDLNLIWIETHVFSLVTAFLIDRSVEHS